MKVFSVFTKNGKVDIPIKDREVKEAVAIVKDPMKDLTEKVRELNDLSNKLVKVQGWADGNKIEKVTFKDVDGRETIIDKAWTEGKIGRGSQDAFGKAWTDEAREASAEARRTGGKGPATEGMINPITGKPFDPFKQDPFFHSQEEERQIRADRGETHIQEYEDGKPKPELTDIRSYKGKSKVGKAWTDEAREASAEARRAGARGPKATGEAAGIGGKEEPLPLADLLIPTEDDASSAQSEVSSGPAVSPNSPKVEAELENRRIGRTMVDQLGGNKFRVMTGANNFVLHDKAISFRIPQAKDGINHVKVTLTPEDTYDVDFTRIRGVEAKNVKSVKGIYADQLRDVFTNHTGLETSLGTMGKAVDGLRNLGGKVSKAWTDEAREASIEARRAKAGLKGPDAAKKITLLARVTNDGSLLGATDDLSGGWDDSFWPDSHDEGFEEGDVETKEINVSPELAQKLLVHGTSDQHFSDGYEARDAIDQETKKMDKVWTDEAREASAEARRAGAKGRPEPGKQYALTGGKDIPSIARGDTWAQSEVKPAGMAPGGKPAEARTPFDSFENRKPSGKRPFARHADWELKNMKHALSSMPLMNSEEENIRLADVEEELGARSKTKKSVDALRDLSGSVQRVRKGEPYNGEKLKQEMFDKEKKEHPEFTDEQIWQIVKDHLKEGKKD